MPLGIGPWEMLIILFIVLLLFGAKRVPEMGRSLGKGMREFKEGVTDPFGADEQEKPVKQLQAGEAPASRVDSTRQQTSG